MYIVKIFQDLIHIFIIIDRMIKHMKHQDLTVDI